NRIHCSLSLEYPKVYNGITGVWIFPGCSNLLSSPYLLSASDRHALQVGVRCEIFPMFYHDKTSNNLYHISLENCFHGSVISCANSHIRVIDTHIPLYRFETKISHNVSL